MSNRSPYLLLAAAAVGVALTAATGTAVAGADVGASAGSVSRGRALVEQRCRGCHDLTTPRDPLTSTAPTFLSLKARFSADGLRVRLREIGENGHYDVPRDSYGMPAVDLTAAQIRDVAAYIQSIRAEQAGGD